MIGAKGRSREWKPPAVSGLKVDGFVDVHIEFLVFRPHCPTAPQLHSPLARISVPVICSGFIGDTLVSAFNVLFVSLGALQKVLVKTRDAAPAE